MYYLQHRARSMPDHCGQPATCTTAGAARTRRSRLSVRVSCAQCIVFRARHVVETDAGSANACVQNYAPPGVAMINHCKIHSTTESGSSITFNGNLRRIPDESCDQTPVRHALVSTRPDSPSCQDDTARQLAFGRTWHNQNDTIIRQMHKLVPVRSRSRYGEVEWKFLTNGCY